jgi:hypothetical protein
VATAWAPRESRCRSPQCMCHFYSFFAFFDFFNASGIRFLLVSVCAASAFSFFAFFVLYDPRILPSPLELPTLDPACFR